MKNKAVIFILLFGSVLISNCAGYTKTPITENSLPTTNTPSFLAESVTLENLNSIPPEGIIEEVSYFVGGMGGDGCFDNRFKKPTFFPELPQSIELVPIEILRSIQVSLCGVSPGESIQLHIQHQWTSTIIWKETAISQSISEQIRGYVDMSISPFTHSH